MNRSEIREQAFRLMYSLEIQKNVNLEEQIELYLESNNIEDKEAIDYIKDAVFGIQKNEDEIIKDMDHDYIEGLSLLGGEPLEPENQEGLAKLVERVKEKYPNKNIWCYTGFDFEKDVMGKMCKESQMAQKLVSNLDVIVDGKFEETQMDKTLRFRGSRNQRIIDVQESMKENHIKLFEF